MNRYNILVENSESTVYADTTEQQNISDAFNSIPSQFLDGCHCLEIRLLEENI